MGCFLGDDDGCLLGEVDGALVGEEEKVLFAWRLALPELVSSTMLSSSVTLPSVVVGTSIVTVPMVTVEGFNDGFVEVDGPKDGFVEVVGPKEGFVDVEGLKVVPKSPVEGFNDGGIELEGLIDGSFRAIGIITPFRVKVDVGEQSRVSVIVELQRKRNENSSIERPVMYCFPPSGGYTYLLHQALLYPLLLSLVPDLFATIVMMVTAALLRRVSTWKRDGWHC